MRARDIKPGMRLRQDLVYPDGTKTQLGATVLEDGRLEVTLAPLCIAYKLARTFTLEELGGAKTFHVERKGDQFV